MVRSSGVSTETTSLYFSDWAQPPPSAVHYSQVNLASAEVTGVPLGVPAATDETDAAFADRLARSAVRPDRVRLLITLDDDAMRVLHAADIAIDVVEPD